MNRRLLFSMLLLAACQVQSVEILDAAAPWLSKSVTVELNNVPLKNLQEKLSQTLGVPVSVDLERTALVNVSFHGPINAGLLGALEDALENSYLIATGNSLKIMTPVKAPRKLRVIAMESLGLFPADDWTAPKLGLSRSEGHLWRVPDTTPMSAEALIEIFKLISSDLNCEIDKNIVRLRPNVAAETRLRQTLPSLTAHLSPTRQTKVTFAKIPPQVHLPGGIMTQAAVDSTKEHWQNITTLSLSGRGSQAMAAADIASHSLVSGANASGSGLQPMTNVLHLGYTAQVRLLGYGSSLVMDVSLQVSEKNDQNTSKVCNPQRVVAGNSSLTLTGPFSSSESALNLSGSMPQNLAVLDHGQNLSFDLPHLRNWTPSSSVLINQGQVLVLIGPQVSENLRQIAIVEPEFPSELVPAPSSQFACPPETKTKIDGGRKTLIECCRALAQEQKLAFNLIGIFNAETSEEEKDSLARIRDLPAKMSTKDLEYLLAPHGYAMGVKDGFLVVAPIRHLRSVIWMDANSLMWPRKDNPGIDFSGIDLDKQSRGQSACDVFGGPSLESIKDASGEEIIAMLKDRLRNHDPEPMIRSDNGILFISALPRALDFVRTEIARMQVEMVDRQKTLRCYQLSLDTKLGAIPAASWKNITRGDPIAVIVAQQGWKVHHATTQQRYFVSNLNRIDAVLEPEINDFLWGLLLDGSIHPQFDGSTIVQGRMVSSECLSVDEQALTTMNHQALGSLQRPNIKHQRTAGLWNIPENGAFAIRLGQQIWALEVR